MTVMKRRRRLGQFGQNVLQRRPQLVPGHALVQRVQPAQKRGIGTPFREVQIAESLPGGVLVLRTKFRHPCSQTVNVQQDDIRGTSAANTLSPGIVRLRQHKSTAGPFANPIGKYRPSPPCRPQPGARRTLHFPSPLKREDDRMPDKGHVTDSACGESRFVVSPNSPFLRNATPCEQSRTGMGTMPRRPISSPRPLAVSPAIFFPRWFSPAPAPMARSASNPVPGGSVAARSAPAAGRTGGSPRRDYGIDQTILTPGESPGENCH